MRLTNDGKLGIGITNPSHQFHVVGTSTITGNTFIGGNLSIGGTFQGRLALGQTLEANIFTTTGVSTFAQVNVLGPIGFTSASPMVDVDFQQASAVFGSVGLGTTNPTGKLKVVGDAFFDSIGIGTTMIQTDPNFSVGGLQITSDTFQLFDSQIKFDYTRRSQIGFGTFGDTLAGVVDLRNAGENSFSPWVYIPQMSTTVRDAKTTATGQNATGIGTGAIIYNKTQKRVEIYLPDGDSNANVGNWVGIASGIGGGTVGLAGRQQNSGSTGNIGAGATTNLTITTAKTYALHKIQTSHAAWVTVYTDTTSRTNDESRPETTDPTPGSGVVAEVIVGAGTTQILSPSVVGFNNDTSPSTNTYLKVVNKTSGTANITVTLHYVQLES